ncbi:hypothetical protein EDB92DRAFT_1814457 [Lactarius akahatsu]|uniref:Uncharacterized protein n=1 Tax=Lactarius akahatsu TaxID=416441 RepID=A0AAD4LKR6_9AGAM|nr:hypothetical protein EDB92DRAFT_1814457 [Lactarius akahatsu]
MWHWNQLQPGGQGTAAHFDAYYKALTDTEKEPFKKEMYVGRGATVSLHGLRDIPTNDLLGPEEGERGSKQRTCNADQFLITTHFQWIWSQAAALITVSWNGVVD